MIFNDEFYPVNSLSFWNNGLRLLVTEHDAAMITNDGEVYSGIEMVQKIGVNLIGDAPKNVTVIADQYEILSFNKVYYKDDTGFEYTNVYDNVGNKILLTNELGIYTEIGFKAFNKPVFKSENGEVTYYLYNDKDEFVGISKVKSEE